MQFIDEAKIYLKAGDGGHGCVSFRRDKYEDMGGPDGGDGGRGSSVIFLSNPHINTLLNFRYKQHFKGENGEYGKGSNRTGKSRNSLILEVPVGTQVFTEDGFLLYDFTKPLEEFEILKGGKGGLGNTHFKSSMNQAPRRRTEGEVGEELNVWLKLKLLSDAGLVGLPNAGKSTFLAGATSAKPKIADYPFTTLKPGLGVVYVGEEEFVLADIPGLIEGAHEGHGLGDKFLKYIERCGVIIHLIDCTAENVIETYETIRNELVSYSELLQDKAEIVCLNKIDAIAPLDVEAKVKALEAHCNKKVHAISTFTREGITNVNKLALQLIKDSRE